MSDIDVAFQMRQDRRDRTARFRGEPAAPAASANPYSEDSWEREAWVNGYLLPIG